MTSDYLKPAGLEREIDRERQQRKYNDDTRAGFGDAGERRLKDARECSDADEPQRGLR